MTDTFKKPSTGFTQVPNKILYSQELSMKAKCLYGYLMSKPNGWQFAAERIAKQMKETEKTVRTGLQELEDSGLLRRNKLKSGRMQYELLSRSLPVKKPTGKKGNQQKGQPAKMTAISNTELLVIQSNSNTELLGEPKDEYSFSVELTKLSESNRVIDRFAAHVIKRKGYQFENKKQFYSYAARCWKVRNKITEMGYTGAQADRTIDYLESEGLAWEVETIIKQIANANNL